MSYDHIFDATNRGFTAFTLAQRNHVNRKLFVPPIGSDELPFVYSFPLDTTPVPETLTFFDMIYGYLLRDHHEGLESDFTVKLTPTNGVQIRSKNFTATLREFNYRPAKGEVILSRVTVFYSCDDDFEIPMFNLQPEFEPQFIPQLLDIILEQLP